MINHTSKGLKSKGKGLIHLRTKSQGNEYSIKTRNNDKNSINQR